MAKEQKIITVIISSIILCLIFVVSSFDDVMGYKEASRIYNVYLKGNLLGSITDKEELYNLIDKKKTNIKEKYDVNKVYPPNDLDIVDTYSYNTTLNDLTTIYNKIESLDDFTVKGYEVRVLKGETGKDYSIYILDKKTLKQAIKKFVLAFIDEEKYKDYINGSQEELTDIGIVYQTMFINEKISVKEKLISINEKIYTNPDELAQALLFGFNSSMNTYEVKEGDTIESVSAANKLNVQEFLIANPKYGSENSLLQVGSHVNITLINPELTFAYSVYEISEVEQAYDKETVTDTSKPGTYSEITQAGVTGLTKVTQHYQVVNGEPSNQTNIDKTEIIREKINQITTKGKTYVPQYNPGFTTYVDTGGSWGWPTESPYVITSPFALRWGRNHNGIDISGTGGGSKIHAASSGVVADVVGGCASFTYNGFCGSGYGNHVVINHGGNLFTLYGHLTNNIRVYKGMQIQKGEVIGYMGNSGRSYGTHLHFGVSNGFPGASGSSYFNPERLFR